MCPQIYWSDSGELCCIATEESFFILKFVADNVAKAQETPELITEDGIEDAFDVRLLLTMFYSFVGLIHDFHLT